MKRNVASSSDQERAPHGPMPAAAMHSRFAQWLIAFFLGVVAACLVLRIENPLGSMALAQSTSLAGARGVFAFTGQLTNDRYGLFMVDVDQGTIWCYQITEKRELDLVSARSWRYDRYLEDFQAGDPSTREVEALVDMQRKTRLQSAGTPPPSSTGNQQGTQNPPPGSPGREQDSSGDMPRSP